MVDFIKNLIGNDVLSTLIMSLVPLIELKGGIVFARGVGLNFFQALGLAYLGSTIVVFPIYFLLRPILKLFKKIKFINVFAHKIEGYIQTKAQETLQKNNSKSKWLKTERAIKTLAVFIFVAIPLPMTGIWMGTAIAVFLEMSFKDTLISAVLGNLVAGLIISVLAQVCLIFWDIAVLDYILYVLFALALILLVLVIIKVATHKTEKEN